MPAILCQMNTALLESNKQVLYDMTHEQYTQPITILNGNLAGHVRHIIEYYNVFFEGFANHKNIEYSHRKRDKTIEASRENAFQAISKIQQQLLQMASEETDTSVQISDDLPNDLDITIHSSLRRELLAVYTHTIHHNAIIKIGLLSIDTNFHFPEHFGIAPSTVAFQQGKILSNFQ